MKKVETNHIYFGDLKLPFRFSINSFIYFTEEYGKEITDIHTIKDAIYFFFCAYKAGCDYSKSDKITYEEFSTLIEDYPESLTILSGLMGDALGTKKK